MFSKLTNVINKVGATEKQMVIKIQLSQIDFFADLPCALECELQMARGDRVERSQPFRIGSEKQAKLMHKLVTKSVFY